MAKIIRQFQRFLFCVLIWSAFSFTVFAVDLVKYHQKISQVKESVEYLLYPEEYLSESQNIANQREIIKTIRTTLAETEKVELKGAIFEVNHGWLFTKLKDFENEPYKSKNREPIIDELVEKLAALELKLSELEKQEISNRTKDENKQKLDEILRRAEFQKPKEQQETFLQRIWREFWEWVDRMFPRPNVNPSEVSQGVQPIVSFLQILLYTVILGLIGFVVYRFAPFFLNRIKAREKKEKKTRVILGETIAAEDSSHNIFAEAENLAQEGNLRGAIRKGYIALLCELSDRKIIGLARHKTNRDYLRDVRNRKEIFSEVNNLTGSFEKNWYGLNPTKEKDWEEFKQTYKQTVSKT
ncbi:MAG TPA: DUF4129 domain-containing protein [Pyrinomonadaceae bacterium]|nr:DUF4129 domain-containing protein [Pyrinomonadaceae bacterium]